jgi:hypothetical protein
VYAVSRHDDRWSVMAPIATSSGVAVVARGALHHVLDQGAKPRPRPLPLATRVVEELDIRVAVLELLIRN